MKRINKKHIKISAITVILAVIALNMPIRFQIGEVSFIVGNETLLGFSFSILNIFLRVMFVYFIIILLYCVLCKFNKNDFKKIFEKRYNFIFSILINLIISVLTVQTGYELNLYLGEYILLFGYPDVFLTFYTQSFWNQFHIFENRNLFNYFSFNPVQLFVNIIIFYFIISIVSSILFKLMNLKKI